MAAIANSPDYRYAKEALSFDVPGDLQEQVAHPSIAAVTDTDGGQCVWVWVVVWSYGGLAYGRGGHTRPCCCLR